MKSAKSCSQSHIIKAFFISSALLLIIIHKTQCMTVKDAMAMVQVAALESGNGDPVVNALTRTMETAQRAIRNAPNDPNVIADSFVRNVKSIVAANGIDVVLPLDCGRHPRNPLNPLSGRSAPLPWIAALGSREQGLFHFRCTGVVIHESHILTDGNCVASPSINVVRINVTSLPGNQVVENFVVGRRLHPSIRSRDDLTTGINIGILELAYPLRFDDYVQPVCIPGLLDEDNTLQIRRFSSTLVGFRNIEDTPRGRTGNLFLLPNSTTDFAPKCSLEINGFNRLNPNRENSLDDILTEDHICVYRNYETVGKSLAMEDMVAAGARRVRVLALGGFANARTPVPIAFTRVQSHRFWIELVIKRFMDNTLGRDRRRG